MNYIYIYIIDDTKSYKYLNNPYNMKKSYLRHCLTDRSKIAKIDCTEVYCRVCQPTMTGCIVTRI